MNTITKSGQDKNALSKILAAIMLLSSILLSGCVTIAAPAKQCPADSAYLATYKPRTGNSVFECVPKKDFY